MSISLAGKNTFQVGNVITQYAIGTGGASTLTGTTTNLNPTNIDQIRFRAQKDLFAATQPGLLEAAFGTVSTDAITSADLLNTVLNSSPALTTLFPNTS